MSQEETKKYFDLERKKHFDFFLPYYQEQNWQVIKDNVDGNCKISCDEKVREGDHRDCLVELIQDIKTGSLGWYFSKKDWILYGSWANIETIYPSSLYLVKTKELENYVCDLEGFIKTCISKKGWGITYNLVLNWDELIKKNIVEKLI